MSDVTPPTADDEPADDPDGGPDDDVVVDRPPDRLDPPLETPVADALDQCLEVPADDEARP